MGDTKATVYAFFPHQVFGSGNQRAEKTREITVLHGGSLKIFQWREPEWPLFPNPPLCLSLPTIYALQTDRLPASGVEAKVQGAL